jgi:hypothetical protein
MQLENKDGGGGPQNLAPPAMILYEEPDLEELERKRAEEIQAVQNVEKAFRGLSWQELGKKSSSLERTLGIDTATQSFYTMGNKPLPGHYSAGFKSKLVAEYKEIMAQRRNLKDCDDKLQTRNNITKYLTHTYKSASLKSVADWETKTYGQYAIDRQSRGAADLAKQEKIAEDLYQGHAEVKLMTIREAAMQGDSTHISNSHYARPNIYSISLNASSCRSR